MPIYYSNNCSNAKNQCVLNSSKSCLFGTVFILLFWRLLEISWLFLWKNMTSKTYNPRPRSGPPTTNDFWIGEFENFASWKKCYFWTLFSISDWLYTHQQFVYGLCDKHTHWAPEHLKQQSVVWYPVYTTNGTRMVTGWSSFALRNAPEFLRTRPSVTNPLSVLYDITYLWVLIHEKKSEHLI